MKGELNGMRFKGSQILIASFVLLLLSGAVRAQADHEKNVVSLPKVVSLRLGDTVVLIPTPPGYEEVTVEFENLKARFAATEPPQSELLLGYLPTSDYELLKNGKVATFEEYTKIAVVRQAKERALTREEFTSVINFIRGNDAKILDPKSPALKKLYEKFDQQLGKELSTEIKTSVDETTVLGAFDERPNLYSTMIFSTIKRDANGKTTVLAVLGTLNVLHIKDRMISIATYRGYHSQADVETLKTFTTNWVNSILTAN